MRVGICAYCGDEVFDGNYTHPECHDAYVAYLFGDDEGRELDHRGGVVDGFGRVHSDADPGL